MSTTTNLAVGLARKAKQVLETKTDDETLLQSLTALSKLDNSDAQTTLLPHQLQSVVEASGVRCATQLLHSAEGVLQQLSLLQQSVAALRSCSEKIRHEIENCSTAMQPYLTSVEKLESAEKLNKEKEKLIDDFLHQYQLLPEEAALLESGELTEEFFKVLHRAQSIHSNCKNLLRTQHQRAGLELMDTMARYQEAALKRLVEWIQIKCQELVDVEAAELDPLMQQALKALSARPVLYRYCAEEVAEARHDALFERFVSSLSQGPRPIEMQSDDPKRYLNDMLAWVHQSLASEIELLELLFQDIQKDEEHSESDLPSITDLMDKIFHSIDRPLKVRIEQVLMLPPAPVLCFEIGCLLEFYVGVIRDVAGHRFAIVDSLQSCLDMCVRTLHEQIHARGTRLMRHSIVVPRDLTPPPEITESLQFLLRLLTAHDSALKATERQEGLSVTKLATAVLDPLLRTCEKCATELENGSLHQDNPAKTLLSKNTFLINCFEAMVTSLHDRPIIQEAWTGLNNQLEHHVEKLAHGIAQALLSQCGLSPVIARMEEYRVHGSTGMRMVDDASLQLSVVSQAMKTFCSLISAADTLPEFSEIVDVDLKNTVVDKMCHTLMEAYEQIYKAISTPDNGYGPPSTISLYIEHTPEHIKTILSIKE